MSEEREGRPIGELLDQRGIRASVDDDDLVTDALVVMKVIDADGHVRLSLAWSEGMSWIERLGMLHAAAASETPSYGLADP